VIRLTGVVPVLSPETAVPANPLLPCPIPLWADLAPQQAVQWFVLRWQLETTFAEVRAKLGVETPRTMLPNSWLSSLSTFRASSYVPLVAFEAAQQDLPFLAAP